MRVINKTFCIYEGGQLNSRGFESRVSLTSQSPAYTKNRNKKKWKYKQKLIGYYLFSKEAIETVAQTLLNRTKEVAVKFTDTEQPLANTQVYSQLRIEVYLQT